MINDLLSDAILNWIAITGIDLNKTSFKLGKWEIYESTEELNKSRLLDETGLTTWMMLRGLTEAYLKEESFSAYDLIFNNGPIKSRLQSMHFLYDALEDPLVIDLIDSFLNKIRQTAKTYEFKNTQALEELLTNKLDLAYIRRDALLSMEKFNAYQFTQGKGDPLPLGMNYYVYEFWNVNSLIRALRSQNIPGVSVVLIRDPQVLHSFFVMAIKNGDTITILTDKEEDAHPAFKRMSRRPDRLLERRANQHWFPYNLLDLKVSEDGKRLYENQRNSLVPINVSAVQLTHIQNLSPEQFIWLMLVTDLIKDKYWTNNHHLPELSYTGEMVVTPEALVGKDSSLVKTGLYKPLELLIITKNDVTNESLINQWQTTPTYFKQWMMDRYKKDVPDSVYNVVGEHDPNRLIGEKDSDVQKIETLDTQSFGNKEKFEKDRLWTARVNECIVINNLAYDEYKETKQELIDWYKEKIQERIEFFAECAVRGELLSQNFVPKRFLDEDEDHNEPINLVTRHIGQTFYPSAYINDAYGDVKLGWIGHNRNYYYCVDKPELKASVFCIFTPNCPESLSIMLGIDVADLPWQLKNWYGQNEPYSGNSILNRLDPIDWKLQNPWRKMTFQVGICFSKRSFNARLKNLNLPQPIIEEKKL